MRHVLAGHDSADAESLGLTDAAMRRVVAAHLDYVADGDVDEQLDVVLLEPGDRLTEVDERLRDVLLTNPYSGKRHGDPGFEPMAETLEDHGHFYEITFLHGDGDYCMVVLVPKTAGIDPELLDLCAGHATPAPDLAA